MQKILLIGVIVAVLILLTLKKRRTKTRLVLFIHNQKKPVTHMQLKKKEFVDAQLGLVKKGTDETIEATFSDVQFESSDESIFKIEDANEDGTLDIVGVGVGNANLTVKANASYRDPENDEPVVNAPKEKVIEITVSAAEAGETELKVTFTEAQKV